MTGFNIEPVVASESSILTGIDKAYGSTKEEDLETVMQSMSEMGDSDVELQSEEHNWSWQSSRRRRMKLPSSNW